MTEIISIGLLITFFIILTIVVIIFCKESIKLMREEIIHELEKLDLEDKNDTIKEYIPEEIHQCEYRVSDDCKFPNIIVCLKCGKCGRQFKDGILKE